MVATIARKILWQRFWLPNLENRTRRLCTRQCASKIVIAADDTFWKLVCSCTVATAAANVMQIRRGNESGMMVHKHEAVACTSIHNFGLLCSFPLQTESYSVESCKSKVQRIERIELSKKQNITNRPNVCHCRRQTILKLNSISTRTMIRRLLAQKLSAQKQKQIGAKDWEKLGKWYREMNKPCRMTVTCCWWDNCCLSC